MANNGKHEVGVLFFMIGVLSFNVINAQSSVRLAGSSFGSEGRLEVLYNGVWGTVCDDNFNYNSAAVACYMLGYGRVGRVLGNQYGPGSGQIWLDDVVCNGTELRLDACRHAALGTNNCQHSKDVSISCTIGIMTPNTITTTTAPAVEGSARLAGSSVAGEGRLEVYYNGSWGTVCDDNFDNNDAAVACYMLGFGRTGLMRNNDYFYGRGKIWLDEVGCVGSETSLAACKHEPWGINDCSHGEDVSISCIPQLACQLDLVFILDSSRSVNKTNFIPMLSFVNNVIGRVSVGRDSTHVAVIKFIEPAFVEFYLTEHLTTATAQAAVSSIPYIEGGTNFINALSLAFSDVFTTAKGARASAIKVAILFTDGDDSDPLAVEKAQQMRNAGIRVMAVGIGPSVNRTNLLRIVSTPNNYFGASDYAQLGDTLAATISAESCRGVQTTTLRVPITAGGLSQTWSCEAAAIQLIVVAAMSTLAISELMFPQLLSGLL